MSSSTRSQRCLQCCPCSRVSRRTVHHGTPIVLRLLVVWIGLWHWRPPTYHCVDSATMRSLSPWYLPSHATGLPPSPPLPPLPLGYGQWLACAACMAPTRRLLPWRRLTPLGGSGAWAQVDAYRRIRSAATATVLAFAIFVSIALDLQ
jgi:hypothetical protein